MNTSRTITSALSLMATTLLAANTLAANLTAVFVHSCDERGNPAGNFVWDTRGSVSDFYKIFITRGSPSGRPGGLEAPFLNGPTWAQAPVNIPLEEGDNDFTIFFQQNGPWRAFAINLFFDNQRVAAICAKAPLHAGDVLPPFTANDADFTYSMTSFPSPNAPASGTTSVTLDRLVELTRFFVADTNVFELDRVWTHGVGGNNRFDFVGAFTLRAGRERRPPPERPVKIDLHITEVTICWDSEPGREYQLQYRARDQRTWTNLGSPAVGTGQRICIADRVPVGEPQRMYRVIDIP